MEFRRCKSLDVIVIIFCALVSGLISPSVDCSGLLQNHSNYSHPTPELQEDGRSEYRVLIKVAFVSPIYRISNYLAIHCRVVSSV